MAIYRPSAVVQLKVRADDFAKSRALTQRLAQSPPTDQQSIAYKPDATRVELQRELAAVNGLLKTLNRSRADISPNQYQEMAGNLKTERSVLQERVEGSGSQKPPLAVSGASPDQLVSLPQILPTSLKIFRNSIQEPDTCSIEIDFRDAPFDPRIVRAAFVTVALGITTADNFTRGMAGEVNPVTKVPLSVVSPSNAFGNNGAVTGFTGWITEWNVDYNGDGEMLKIEALDMTELLRITRLDQGDGVDLNLPIRVGVKKLIDSYAGTFGIRVLMDKVGEDNGDGPIPSGGVPKARKARRGKVSRRARSGNEDMSLWEHITDVCGSISILPSFFGNDLRLIQPQAFNIGVDAPRVMVYGRNVEKMNFVRHIGGHKSPTIEARCYSAKQGRAIWARYPVLSGKKSTGVKQKDPNGRPTRPTQTGVSGAQTADTVKVVQTQGYDDVTTLQRFAENYWYAMSKQEIEGSFDTRDIDSFSYVDTDAGTQLAELEGFGDMLRIQPGDAIELLIAGAVPEGAKSPDNDPSPTSAQRLASMAVERRMDYLEELGYDRNTAEVLANSYNNPGFPSTFRVKDASYTFDPDDGIGMTIGFVNFVVVPDDRKKTEVKTGPRAAAATKNRRSAAAREAEAKNKKRRSLTDQRFEGQIGNDEYAKNMGPVLDDEKRALGTVLTRLVDEDYWTGL